MLARTLVALSLIVPLGVMACSDDDGGEPSEGSGGSPNTGGSKNSGGSGDTGGAKSTGGGKSTGGAAPGDGGASSSGGASDESGGTSGSGGSNDPDGSVPEDDGGANDAAPPSAPTCTLISVACGILDAPNQPQALRDCAALGSSDEATCQAQLDGCRTICAKTLCNRLGSYCHDPDPGSGPIHDCHEFNHAGSEQDATEEEVAWCFNEAPRCLELCREARGD